MFQPIKFKSQNGIDVDRLKLDIDRRISKVAWMVDQRLRKHSLSNTKLISHNSVQTDPFNSLSLRQNTQSVRKLNQSIGHTRENSGMFAINNIDNHSLSLINGGTHNFVSEASIESYAQINSNNFIPSKLQQQMRLLIQDASAFERIQRQQIGKNIINEEIESSNEDSLDGSFFRKGIESARDNRVFNNEENLKQSVLLSRKSVNSQEYIQKQNDQSINKDVPNNVSKQKTDKNSELSKEAKRKGKVKKNQNKKIEVPFELNSNYDNYNRFFEECEKEVRKGFFQSRNASSKNLKKVEKVNIANDVKARMEKVVQELVQSDRNQSNDHTARSNLLKRIQEKFKPKQK